MNIIDLRSDTVTRPSGPMRNLLALAEVGDDVYGEDPAVNRLQELAAELTGKQAGLFVPSGTMSNLLALLSHCQRGDEYIAGQQAHCYRHEGGGAAALGGIQPQPLEFQANGTLDLQQVKAIIKPADAHFAKTKLLCLENTQDGKVLSLDYQEEAAQFCHENGLALHLDGARVCNAAIAQDVPLTEICQQYDSVSLCLSKGLGAPVGSVLLGSQEFIEQAHRWRKVCGGGMRQAGVLAEAGSYALQHQLQRLAADHGLARRLAEGLAEIDELQIDLQNVQTNMVFIDSDQATQDRLKEHLKQRGILVGGYGRLRLVTHLDINPNDLNKILTAIKDFFAA